jgi:hypothetical protein
MGAWPVAALPQLSHRLSNLSRNQKNGIFQAVCGGIKQKNPPGSAAGRMRFYLNRIGRFIPANTLRINSSLNH